MACSASALSLSQNEIYHKHKLAQILVWESFLFESYAVVGNSAIFYRPLIQQFIACILILRLCYRGIAEIMTKWHQIIPTCFLSTPDRQSLARHAFASKLSIYWQFSPCLYGWAFCVDLFIAVKRHIFWTVMSLNTNARYAFASNDYIGD